MSNPWEVEGSPWETEAAFLGWVKGAIRKGWGRHPIRTLKLKGVRVRAPLGRKTKKNPKGVVWCVPCEACNQIVRQSAAEVDHKHKMEEEKWYHNIEAFVKRMYWVSFDDLQVLCKPCHQLKTLSDRLGKSLEEVEQIEKPRIEFGKKKAKEQIDILNSLGILPLKTKEYRIQQYVKYLEKQYASRS